MDKPTTIVGRDRQWRSTERFLFDGGIDGPLRIGLVSGRRRTGKTQLLAAACKEVGGLYTVCVQDEGDRAARARFAGTIAEHAGLPASALGQPEPWERLLRSALETAARTARTGQPPLVVIDEFPYATANAPQLPSLIQHLYDASQNGNGPGGRLVLCGSALSVMHELLSGAKPLRGRVMMDLRLPALDYREAARLWGIADPAAALRVHACVGGIPGYRSLITSAPGSIGEFDEWVIDNLLTTDIGVFTHTEVDYLLREDPRISSRALYFDILSAVASGNSTPSKIGAAIGRDANSVRYPIGVLESAGYLTKSQDMLRARKPTITVSDPVIRFDRLITAPHLGQLEFGRAQRVWQAAAPTFRSNILGAHFEELARDWTLRFAPDELGSPAGFGDVGFATVQDNPGRCKHEIDVLAMVGQRVTVIGEAKATLDRRGLPDLERLVRIKELLTDLGHDTTDVVLALFCTTGFTVDLERTAASRPDIQLIDLDRLYQPS
ncbi:AAA family ATPase [Nocardia pseudovaccinii]|uniref:AAA family ATPase n=1 Tax=Nocardia pseudovaccinii TaxID=189540 RepID=UPI0007A54BCD|nr:ATP-binding protein [Nocardia pseudovaccinii]